MADKAEGKKSGGFWRGLLAVFCILLALVLIVTAVAGAYVNYLMNKVNYVADQSVLSPSEVEHLLKTDPDLESIDPSESLPELDDSTFPTEQSKPVEKPDHVINILLIGQDETEPGVRARSDSMILVTFNTSSKEVTFTSFMRDAYVQIPGYGANKLNHAYQYGGMKLLNKTLQANYGVQVDGDVEINFAQFKEIIDLLGGVQITLTEKEAKYMNHSTKWGLVPGKNLLTGEQALVYARLREIDSDYQRTQRQRTVLMALAQAYKDLPPDQMLEILEQLMGYVTTNMTTDQMWKYGFKVVYMLGGASYGTLQIPADGTFDQGSVQVRPGLKGWFQYNIDFERNRGLLRELLEE